MRRFHLRDISQAERKTLKQMYKNAPKTRLRQRAHMVLLAEAGQTLIAISTLVGVCYNSVCRYVAAFADIGFLAMYDAPKSGARQKLTFEQKKQIEQWLSLSPRQLHYQQGIWTMKLMRRRIIAVYGVTLTTERVRQIVRGAGFTLVRPKYQSRLSNPKEVEKAQEELNQKIEQAKRGEIVLFYQDEARLSRFPTLTRIWVRKGTQHQIPTDDDHTTFWAYAIANPLNGKVHYRLEPSLCGEGFVKFLQQIRTRYSNSQIVLITDNASAHRAKGVKQYLETDPAMQFYHLPAYSPKLNRIERLWKWLRQRVTHVHFFDSIAKIKHAVRNFFRYVNRVPNKVRSCLATSKF